MALNPKITDWQGKSVWLIGASTGIGAALATDLLRLGASVVLSSRGLDKLQALVASQPEQARIKAHAVAFDFTDAQQTQAAWAQVQAAVGVPDVVIINAGTYVAMKAKYFAIEGFNNQFAANVNGPAHVLECIIAPMLARQSGHIQLVSSVAGWGGLPRAVAYGASKAALSYMAQTLYIELSGKGVGVSVVCPGFVKTPLTAGNEFHMPALITPEVASAEIIKGLRKGQFEIHFPRRFSNFLRLLRLLPWRLYFYLIKKTV